MNTKKYVDNAKKNKRYRIGGKTVDENTFNNALSQLGPTGDGKYVVGELGPEMFIPRAGGGPVIRDMKKAAGGRSTFASRKGGGGVRSLFRRDKSPLKKNKLNVVGEQHDISNTQRDEEQRYSEIFSGSPNYSLINLKSPSSQ